MEKQNSTLSGVMTPDPACVTLETSVFDAAALMRSENVGLIPVVRSASRRELAGVITDRDIAIRVVAEGLAPSSTPVSGVMSRSPKVCTPSSSVDEAMDMMADSQVRRIPVVDETGCLVGIFSQADMARSAAVSPPERTASVLAEISA